MSSVQLYTLRDKNNQLLWLRQLETQLPLQCRQIPQELSPLEARGVLQQSAAKSDVRIVLDPHTLRPLLKTGGVNLDIQQDAEGLRLQQFLVRCWINLLKARESQLGVLHTKELQAAREALKKSSLFLANKIPHGV